MTRGWFDAFRENGGPTLYSYSNRTAVTADVATLTLYIVFVTLFLAFVIIFPGVRRQRFTTFTSVTLSLFVGTAILGEFFTLSTNQNKHWHIFLDPVGSLVSTLWVVGGGWVVTLFLKV